MEATRTFRSGPAIWAARSGVPRAGIVRWQASPTRRSALDCDRVPGAGGNADETIWA